MDTKDKPMTPDALEAREDIKAAIAFYEARGWDWLDAVAFLSAKAVGMWPLPKGWRFYRERPRKVRR